MFAIMREHQGIKEIRSPQHHLGRKKDTQKFLQRRLIKTVESMGSNTRKNIQPEKIVKNEDEPQSGGGRELGKISEKGKERTKHGEKMKAKEAPRAICEMCQ